MILHYKVGDFMENNIGLFIKKLRKEKHITQEQLAKKLNVSVKVVSKWETGERQISTEMIKPICKTFNITETELLNGKKDRSNKLFKVINIIVVVLFIIILILFVTNINKDTKKDNKEENKEIQNTKELYEIKSIEDSSTFIQGYMFDNERYNIINIYDIQYDGPDENAIIDFARVEIDKDDELILASSIEEIDDLTITLKNHLNTLKLLQVDTSKQLDSCFEDGCEISIKITYQKRENKDEKTIVIKTEYNKYR